MANLDTTAKRLSGINPSCPWRSFYPFPDGSIDADDRQTIAFLYSGILAGLPVPPVVVTPTVTEGVGGGRRPRYRIRLRIDGEEREIADLATALAVIKAAKDEIPEIAKDTAQDLVISGKRVGEAKREESAAIVLVEAPSSVRQIIEDRIAEMQRLYWRRVAAYKRELEDDDEEMDLIL